MAPRPSFNENRYFLSKNAERRSALRDRLDAAARRLSEQEGIATALGTDDPRLLERIQALGFNGDSARVFDLLPLIHVSWADGRIQRDERATLFALLEQRGIEPESDACLLVESLLERRPSEAFLNETLGILRALIGSDGDRGTSIVALCRRVAEASGGLLGLGSRTGAEEAQLIEEVAEALGEAAQSRFREGLDGG